MGIAALLEDPPNQSSSASISRLPVSSFHWCIWELSTAEQIGCDPSNCLCVGHLYKSGVPPTSEARNRYFLVRVQV
jgi:hypothetical protein